MNIGGCACGGVNCPYCNPNRWIPTAAYITTDNSAVIRALEAEIAEQARLLDMSATREVKLETLYKFHSEENWRLRGLLDTAKVIEKEAIFEARIKKLEKLVDVCVARIVALSGVEQELVEKQLAALLGGGE